MYTILIFLLEFKIRLLQLLEIVKAQSQCIYVTLENTIKSLCIDDRLKHSVQQEIVASTRKINQKLRKELDAAFWEHWEQVVESLKYVPPSFRSSYIEIVSKESGVDPYNSVLQSLKNI